MTLEVDGENSDTYKQIIHNKIKEKNQGKQN